MNFAVFERAFGLGEIFQTLVGALLLESFEFGDCFVELIVEAALLQSDVGEVLSIGQVDVAEKFTYDNVVQLPSFVTTLSCKLPEPCTQRLAM